MIVVVGEKLELEITGIDVCDVDSVAELPFVADRERVSEEVTVPVTDGVIVDDSDGDEVVVVLGDTVGDGELVGEFVEVAVFDEVPLVDDVGELVELGDGVTEELELEEVVEEGDVEGVPLDVPDGDGVEVILTVDDVV